MDVEGSGLERCKVDEGSGPYDDLMPEKGLEGPVERATDQEARLERLAVEELCDEPANLLGQVEDGCHFFCRV